MRKFIFLLAAALCLNATAFSQETREIKATYGSTYATAQSSYMPSFKVDGSKAKIHNVILLIGDGMGLGAVNAAMFANGGSLTMTNLQSIGFVRTQSADDFVTDSAASGTAYASGHKTKNGYLGVDPDGKSLENLPEKLSPLGYACGVISTDDLTGATPAAFYAHQSARSNSEPIWGDLPASPLVFASAGTRRAYEAQKLNLKEDIEKNFTVVYSLEDEAFASSKKLIYFPESVNLDRGDYLARTTEKAIEFLSSKKSKGFFLMVEGARIDKSAHSNDIDGTLKETLDFDKAIEAAIRFAEKDGHTLVIISADHETGAFSTAQGDPTTGYISGSFASKGHSSMMVPLFAFGPRSREFAVIQENSDVSNKIYQILSSKK